jgi:hypothetical protein
VPRSRLACSGSEALLIGGVIEIATEIVGLTGWR